jgi:hypothetical protein
MSVCCYVLGSEVLDCELKRARGRLSSPSSRPLAVEAVRPPGRGAWGEEIARFLRVNMRSEGRAFWSREGALSSSAFLERFSVRMDPDSCRDPANDGVAWEPKFPGRTADGKRSGACGSACASDYLRAIFSLVSSTAERNSAEVPKPLCKGRKWEQPVPDPPAGYSPGVAAARPNSFVYGKLSINKIMPSSQLCRVEDACRQEGLFSWG